MRPRHRLKACGFGLDPALSEKIEVRPLLPRYRCAPNRGSVGYTGHSDQRTVSLPPQFVRRLSAS